MARERIWDNFIVVGEVQKSSRLKLVIAAATRDGFRCLCIREWYFRQRDEKWLPGRDGITIPLKASLNAGESFITPAKDFNSLFVKAAKEAVTMELFDEKNAVWQYKENA